MAVATGADEDVDRRRRRGLGAASAGIARASAMRRPGRICRAHSTLTSDFIAPAQATVNLKTK
jgi:hypothetical protein